MYQVIDPNKNGWYDESYHISVPFNVIHQYRFILYKSGEIVAMMKSNSTKHLLVQSK